jgi:hypothetical protein
MFCAMLLTDKSVEPSEVFAAAGWELKPEGACRGPVCVPLGDATTVEAIAERLGMPMVSNNSHGLAAIGPATTSGRALTSAAAPDLELPLVVGDGVWRLADQRGRRTVMVAWAPW